MSDLDRQLREEMDEHVRMRAAHDGITTDEARRKFGNQGMVHEDMRRMHIPAWLDAFRQDLRYAVRGIRRNPGFTATAVGVLGLAIASITTLFTLYSSYVLKPLPIRGADRNHYIAAVDQKGRHSTSWSKTQFEQLAAAGHEAFDGLYAEDLIQTAVLRPVEAEAFVSFVSPGYFTLTGARLLTGRFFNGEEERAGNYMLLSHSGWRRLMHEDPQAVGKILQIRSTQFTIVGILDPVFTGTEPVIPDFWIPMTALHKVRVADFERPFTVSGILREGVSARQAEQIVQATALSMDRGGNADEKIARLELQPRPSFIAQGPEIHLAAAMVFAIFLLVLMIACANLANLQLARAAARKAEIGIRLSVGASRSRIVRQLLTESFVIGVLSAIFGLATAAFGVTKLQDYLFSEAARWGLVAVPAALDWRVFVFSAFAAILSGFAFGLLPALQATASARKDRGFRMRGYLISGQAAASLVLLIVSGLLIRNTQSLYAADPGFDMDRIMDLRSQEPSSPAFLDKLRADPAVAAVSLSGHFPLSGSLPRTQIATGGVTHLVGFNRVDEHYFNALGIKVTQGHGFTRGSREKIVVVSEATARKLWPGQNPLGKIVDMAEEGGRHAVAGVVPDVISGWMFQGKDATMLYLPLDGGVSRMSVIVRAASDLNTVKAALRGYCAKADVPNVCDPMTASDTAGMQRFPFQAAALIASCAGCLGLVLTCIGLFGVVSFTVAQRSRDIGIYLALGAQSGQVVRKFVREAFGWVLLGILVGLPLCLGLSAIAASQIFSLRTFDPVAYVTVPFLLVTITLVSCFIPARRAARVDPMTSLRQD